VLHTAAFIPPVQTAAQVLHTAPLLLQLAALVLQTLALVSQMASVPTPPASSVGAKAAANPEEESASLRASNPAILLTSFLCGIL